jgi:hypothetical protein
LATQVGAPRETPMSEASLSAVSREPANGTIQYDSWFSSSRQKARKTVKMNGAWCMKSSLALHLPAGFIVQHPGQRASKHSNKYRLHICASPDRRPPKDSAASCMLEKSEYETASAWSQHAAYNERTIFERVLGACARLGASADIGDARRARGRRTDPAQPAR